MPQTCEEQHNIAPKNSPNLKNLRGETLDLDPLATALGVRIVDSPRLHPDLNAIYLHPRRMILIRPGLDPITYRCALAHELGHAFYQDEDHGNPRLEKRADLWAARLLISPVDYMLAERLHDGHIGAIAHELGVTPHLATTWRNHHLILKEAL
ncbi:ImmA/IrrE family metallo-endopeptidase [Staphylococcus chromogenes]|nr:ImmA/IrrE family metallo-endopeptidase [Staphylococcus chromogenes]